MGIDSTLPIYRDYNPLHSFDWLGVFHGDLEMQSIPG